MNHLQLGSIAVGALTLTACATSQTKKTESKRPNIIHIMTDDHAFQAISAYGHPISQLAPTPNIDRLAKEGMLFTKAFVENSLSTPSRACLMTGLYSHQNGQRTLDKGIDTSKVFFSELLQEDGYQTGVFGKWHMQCEPKGFDSYYVLNDQGDYYNPEFRSKTSDGKYIREEGYATTLITDHAIEFLKNRDVEKPFCMLVHHKAPHRNWMPETKYLDLYEDVNFPYPETFYDDYSTRSEASKTQEMRIEDDMTLGYDLKVSEVSATEKTKQGWYKGASEREMSRMTDEQRDAWIEAYTPKNEAFLKANLKGDDLLKWKYQRYVKDYLRCIKSVDDQIGRLLEYLDKEGLTDNTIIVYTSDQGFYMGEHGWFDKRFMYEESFRTPLIIRYPEKVKAGTTCEALVQNIDFAPTYLSVAGLDKATAMVGTTLAPLFGGEVPADWRSYIYYHYYDYPAIHQVRRHDGVRDNRYKLIHFYGESNNRDKAIDANELYDLQTDPTETQNLYDSPSHAEIRTRLQSQLDLFRQQNKVDEY